MTIKYYVIYLLKYIYIYFFTILLRYRLDNIQSIWLLRMSEDCLTILISEFHSQHLLHWQCIKSILLVIKYPVLYLGFIYSKALFLINYFMRIRLHTSYKFFAQTIYKMSLWLREHVRYHVQMLNLEIDGKYDEFVIALEAINSLFKLGQYYFTYLLYTHP